MTRREAAEKIFDYIKSKKFTPINIEYGDCYFIFDKGTDGVVHFNIKELRGWKFGMWIEVDAEKLKTDRGADHPAVQFFCQHIFNIDKFKPSRSFFEADLRLYELEHKDSWYLYKIDNILQMIKRHPCIAFTMDHNEDELHNGSYIYCYLRQKIRRDSEIIRDWCKDAWVRIWHGSKVWFIKKHKVVSTVGLKDLNSGGWKCSTRYVMKIHFRKISDDEHEQCKAEIKVLDRFFRKNYYKNMDLMLTRDGVDGRYSYDMK